jgi:heme-degrading monooxygenase HmoA
MDDATLASAKEQPGFLGYESLSTGNRSSFISYWESLDSIDNWRNNALHLKAKTQGKKQWYQYYHAIIARVESIHFHKKDE